MNIDTLKKQDGSEEFEPEPILFKLYKEMNIEIDCPRNENGEDKARKNAFNSTFLNTDLKNFSLDPLNRYNSEEMFQNAVVKPKEESIEEQKTDTLQENLTSSKNLDNVSSNLNVRLRFKPATSRLGDFKTEEWIHNWYQKRPESLRRRHAQSTVSIPPRNDFERRTGLRVGYKYTFPSHLPSDFQKSEEDDVS
ncbi:hypothetical protein ACTXT7_000040 [Hymenolepis weldensis]